MMMAAEYHYTYTGRDGDIVPVNETHVRIHESLTAILRRAFHGNFFMEEVDCHNKVGKVEEGAFLCCISLRRFIMPGVKVIEDRAFYCCEALTDVECGKLEIIGGWAFRRCNSLRSINLSTARILKAKAFDNCKALTDVKFGNKLERIEDEAFALCTSLRNITIPLKDNMITRDNIFRGCENLERVDLVGGIHETIAALQLEEWRNDMNEEIDSINQILPITPAGGEADDGDVGEKAIVIRTWTRSVLRKLIGFKEQHHRLLDETATTLELALPKDIAIKNIIPFLELPSFTFED